MAAPLPDLKTLRSLLEQKTDPAWQDDAGNSLLHHAARLGDIGLVKQCLSQGVKALARNKKHEYAADIARHWGHDAVAKQIDTEMRRETASMPAPAAAFSSLQEIRNKSAATGDNIFYELARQGRFDQVMALVSKNSPPLTAADLLGRGANGETVILEICRQGQLPLLLKPELWLKNTADFLAVWENVPRIYQKELDMGGFMSRIHQIRLQSRASKVQWKGPS